MGRGSGERVKVKGGVMRAKGSGDSGKSGRLKGYFEGVLAVGRGSFGGIWGLCAVW